MSHFLVHHPSMSYFPLLYNKAFTLFRLYLISMPKGQFVNAFHTVPLPCSIYVLSTFPFRFPRLFKDSHHVLFLTASQELVKLFKVFFFFFGQTL